MPLIERHTKKGSLYYTDEHTAYASLRMRGKHQVIAHGMEEYVRKDAPISCTDDAIPESSEMLLGFLI